MDTANAVQAELQREAGERHDTLGVVNEAPLAGQDGGCTDSALCGDIEWGGPAPFSPVTFTLPDALMSDMECDADDSPDAAICPEAETLDSDREDIESDFAGQ